MAPGQAGRERRLWTGAVLFMVLCCAVGPAVIGAIAGSAIGGWLGIAAACLTATTVALIVYARRRGKHC